MIWAIILLHFHNNNHIFTQGNHQALEKVLLVALLKALIQREPTNLHLDESLNLHA